MIARILHLCWQNDSKCEVVVDYINLHAVVGNKVVCGYNIHGYAVDIVPSV